MTKLLTPSEIKEILHIGINQTYKLMNSNGFPAIRLNHKIVVPEDKFEEWIKKYTGKTYLF